MKCAKLYAKRGRNIFWGVGRALRMALRLIQMLAPQFLLGGVQFGEIGAPQKRFRLAYTGPDATSMNRKECYES